MNVNRDLYSISHSDSTFSFDSENQKKTNFSLQLLTDDDYLDYQTPSYIVDGLIWLNNQDKVVYPVTITVKEKNKRKLTLKTIKD